MTDKEKTALAILSSGSSFKETSDLTGIPLDLLVSLAKAKPLPNRFENRPRRIFSVTVG